MPDMHDIFDEIVRERVKQNDQWGGVQHDDEHVKFDWIHLIEKQCNRAHQDQTEFRSRMIKIAALAVAAIESHDRKNEGPNWEKAKAHFDEVRKQYQNLEGTPGVNTSLALRLTFDPLAKRYNGGERTQDLYDSMLDVE